MTKRNIKVTSRQVAIGQGGLMTCQIEVSDGLTSPLLFNFAFDCGSINREHLKQGIETLDRGVLDILFISHLDADHINGIDLLLDKMDVKTVVLPCLDALQATAIVCEALNGTGLTGDFRSFLLNPAIWFSQRGVQRVIYISRDGGNDEVTPFTIDGPGPLKKSRGLRDEQSQGRRLNYSLQSNGTAPQILQTRTSSIEIETASTENAFEIDLDSFSATNNIGLTWLLVPYVHPFPKDRIDAFRRSVRAALVVPAGESLASAAFTKRLLDTLKYDDKRELLKACYAILCPDNNKPSLSLYSGPHQRPNQVWRIRRPHRYFWDYPHGLAPHLHSFVIPPLNLIQDGGGWLCTGDADLRSKGTRKAWLSRYKNLLEQVTVFILPHHGSNASLDDEVISRMKGTITVACAAQGRAHHPHPTLIARLRDEGVAVWHVSEEMNTTFSMQVLGSP